MSQTTFTSISPDQAVLQQLFWDRSIGSIDVVHQINVEPLVGARLGFITQYKEGHPDYIAKCKDYEIDPKDKKVISEYIYDEFQENRDYRTVLTFPGVGNFFYLSGTPHLVVAILNKLDSKVSKTSGEAL